MSSCSERPGKQETRAKKANLEQMQLFSTDKSVEVLSGGKLVVDHNKLKVSHRGCI